MASTKVTHTEEKPKSKLKGILDGLSLTALWTLIFLSLIAAVVLFGIPLLQGARPTTVTTNSMSPTIKPGDLVMVKKASAEDIQIDDIAQIQTVSGGGDDTKYVHRVMAVSLGDKNKRTIITKGDNNKDADPPVIHPEQVIGKLTAFPGTDRLYVIRKIGWIKNDPKLWGGIAAALILFGLFAPSRKKEEVVVKEIESTDPEYLEFKRFKEEKEAREREEYLRWKESQNSNNSVPQSPVTTTSDEGSSAARDN